MIIVVLWLRGLASLPGRRPGENLRFFRPFYLQPTSLGWLMN